MPSSDRANLYLPAREAGGDGYQVDVSPESAGWGYSSLKVLALDANQTETLHTGPDEIIVVPLSGSALVAVGDDHLELAGRPSVFAGPTDFAYVPRNSTMAIGSVSGGRFALCGARTEADLPLRYGPAAEVPVELRGAGQCSRQVRNFGTPEALEAGSIIACEVITPGGNWSSYPAHKHDQASEHESELEEIYYFEIESGPQGEPGIGFFRTSSSPGHDIDLCLEVHDRDTVLVPYGWHGPASAAPGQTMYYLNVMAGPGERVWKISDHPDQAWIRAGWADQQIDPRLTSK